jgi:hypothetical protein
MKVWITKYALTIGIESMDGEVSEQAPSMFCPDNRAWSYFHGEGREWHRTEAAAIARAEEMRVAKIASLRKSITKLEKLSFSRKRELEAGEA